MGIIEESKRARKKGMFGIFKNKKVIIPALIIFIIAAGAYYFLKDNSSDGEMEVKKKEWTVKQGNIQVAIETDGKVVAEDGVELSFSVSGDTLEVEEVFIKEGDKIARGDKIATVKTESLEFILRSAYSSYLSAKAAYEEKQAGATEEEMFKAKAAIEQARISLEQSSISLEKIKLSAKEKIADAESTLKTAEDNLKNNQDEITSEAVNEEYEDMVDTVKSINITLEGILPESDEIIGVDISSINDAFEQNLGAKDISTLSAAQNSYNTAKQEKFSLDALAVGLSINSTHTEIDTAADQVSAALVAFENHLYKMSILLEATISSSDLTQTALDAFKTTINANRTTINTKISTLLTAQRSIEDAKDDLEDFKTAYNDAVIDLENTKETAAQDIANSEAGLAAKELSLEQAEADYKELLAPLTASELASAQSSLTSASINLEKARYEIEKAVLKSPIDGEVAMLNYKAGDIILKDDTKPVAVIINNDTLFIEVNIEEADINKLKVGQKALATFDALDSKKLEGEISFISLTSETDNSGIVTYLVRVLFENTDESQIREGMTAFVDFVIAGVSDVLTVPVNAVRNVSGKPSVEMQSGEWRSVVTGFTDGDDVEVISGLSAGERIVY